MKEEERNLMNEKHKKKLRNRLGFSTYGRVKERSEKGRQD